MAVFPHFRLGAYNKGYISEADTYIGGSFLSCDCERYRQGCGMKKFIYPK